MKKPPEGGFEKPDKSKNQPRPKKYGLIHQGLLDLNLTGHF